MKNSVRTSVPQAPIRENSCRFTYADGRQCRMPRWRKNRFCLPHARQEQPLLAAEQVERELVSISGEFKTASDVNHVLGKVFTLFAQNRLARRDAVAFAYLGQLLLQSLPNVRREIRDAQGYDAWMLLLKDTLGDQPRPQSRESSTSRENNGENGSENFVGPSMAEVLEHQRATLLK